MRYEQGEFEVRYDPARIAVAELIEVVQAKGFNASLEPPANAVEAPAPLTEEERAALDISTITHGDSVRLEDHLARGKFTIVDYFSDWCGPCKLLEKRLERLASARDDVAVRKVDIVDWKSNAAAQARTDFGLEAIPYVRVYGPDGSFVGEVEGNDPAAIEALLAR